MIHVAFEGPDGVGKSTIINALVERLSDYKVVAARHPGFTHLGDIVQRVIKFPADNGVTDYPLSDKAIQLLMMAEYTQFETVIDQHYRDYIVLSDRCNMISAYVYGTAAKLHPRIFHRLMDVIRPRWLDGLFMISAPLGDVQARLGARTKDSFEARNVLFHDSVRAKYGQILNSGYMRKLVDERNVFPMCNDGSLDDIVTRIYNTIVGKYLSQPLVAKRT